MDGCEPIKVAGIEVPTEERTPLVDQLLRVIEEQRAEIWALRDEIARSKGLPPRPTLRPSTLNEPHPDPRHKKQRRGKRPGSAKRQKTDELMIHETIPVPLEELPDGTQQNGYEDFVSYSDRSLSGAWPSKIADELKQIHKLGLAGVASQCELDNWGAYGLNYWVAARMRWNPTVPLNDVLADYFNLYYAETAALMQAYFACLESLGRITGDLTVSKGKLEKLDALLTAGERAARSEPVRARIHRDRIAFDYLRMAWTIEDARRNTQSLVRAGNQQATMAELRRGATACQNCLGLMAQHRHNRVFLVGDPDNPRQRIGYSYNTRYYRESLKRLTKELAQLAAKEEDRVKEGRAGPEEKNKTAPETRLKSAQE